MVADWQTPSYAVVKKEWAAVVRTLREQYGSFIDRLLHEEHMFLSNPSSPLHHDLSFDHALATEILWAGHPIFLLTNFLTAEEIQHLDDQTYIRWNHQRFSQSIVPWQRDRDASLDDLFEMIVSFRRNAPLGVTKRPPDHLNPIVCADRQSASDNRLLLVEFAWHYTRPEDLTSLDDDVWTCYGLRYKRLQANIAVDEQVRLFHSPNLRFDDIDPSAPVEYFAPPDLESETARPILLETLGPVWNASHYHIHQCSVGSFARTSA